MSGESQSNAGAERRNVYFSGRVQGVGFRQTTWQIARRHPVRGYVRNLSDGRVELVAEGSASALDEFLADLQGEMERHIRHVEVYNQSATDEFRDFSIRH